jgi:NTP pyrophosphatase (non-canonical NTP hydrolase)
MDCITTLNSEFIINYGAVHQLEKNIEELDELIIAITRLIENFDKQNVPFVVDEVADVLFTTLQTAIMIGDSAVSDRIIFKARRLIQQIDEEIIDDVPSKSKKNNRR